MAWLRKITPKVPTRVVNRGEYESGAIMSDPDRVTKVDFLPADILSEITKNVKNKGVV